MDLENQRGHLLGKKRTRGNFPAGMRVLVVDDDPVFLKLLQAMLLKCEYDVTTTNKGVVALKMLRENKNKFDLVISDVFMPGIDGFKLLKLVVRELDIPVVMVSAESNKNLVMKGLQRGACNYLQKPVQIEVLKNIWQHVVLWRIIDLRVKPSKQDKDSNIPREGSEDEEEDIKVDDEEINNNSFKKKPRVIWTSALHAKFVAAVDQLGLKNASGRKILDLMDVEGLTRHDVASHLQKFKQYLKRNSSCKNQHSNIEAILGNADTSNSRMGSLSGVGPAQQQQQLGTAMEMDNERPLVQFNFENPPDGNTQFRQMSSLQISPIQSMNMSLARAQPVKVDSFQELMGGYLGLKHDSGGDSYLRTGSIEGSSLARISSSLPSYSSSGIFLGPNSPTGLNERNQFFHAYPTCSFSNSTPNPFRCI